MMKTHWLYRKENHRTLWIGGGVLLLLTVVAEFFIEHHAYFGIDGLFSFSALYGFISCVAMVLFAKGLGYLLKRPDDYYDE